MINTTFLKIQLTLIIYLVNKHYSKINWCLWAEQNQVTGYFTSKCYFKDLQVFFWFCWNSGKGKHVHHRPPERAEAGLGDDPVLDLETRTWSRQINPNLQSSKFSSSPPNMIDFLFWQVRFDEKINNKSRKIFLFYLQRNLN